MNKLSMKYATKEKQDDARENNESREGFPGVSKIQTLKNTTALSIISFRRIEDGKPRWPPVQHRMFFLIRSPCSIAPVQR